MLYNLKDLRWQFDWNGGNSLYNKRILVCRRCYDLPQPQLRSRVIGPDPIPVQNARPENYAAEEGPTPNSGSPTNNQILDSSGNAILDSSGFPFIDSGD
jgi:hypothetical protein